MKKTKSEKVKEEIVAQPMEVITLEEFQELDASLQAKIIEVTEELNLKQVSMLNPMIIEIVGIEKLSMIKYKKDDPQSIQQFKDSIKRIRSFRAEVSRTKLSIKRPMIEAGRKLDAIEKKFKADATKVEEKLNTEFDAYLKEKAEKEAAKAAAKEAERNAEIENLSKENQDAKKVIERMKIYGEYNRYVMNLTIEATKQADNYNAEKLNLAIAYYENLEFDLSEEEKVILLDEQYEELRLAFNVAKNTCLRIIEASIEKHKKQTAETIKSRTQEEINQIIADRKEIMSVNTPSITTPSSKDFHPNFICQSILTAIDEAIVKIQNLSPATELEKIVCGKSIAGLTAYKGKIRVSLTKES